MKRRPFPHSHIERMFNIARSSLAASAKKVLAAPSRFGAASRAMSSEEVTFDLTGSFEVSFCCRRFIEP